MEKEKLNEEQKKKSGRLKWIIIGLVALVVLGIISDSSEQEGSTKTVKKENLAKIGEFVNVGDTRWKILKAFKQKRIGNIFNSKTTSGYFLIVYGIVRNTGKETRSTSGILYVIDSKGRRFESIDDEYMYLPDSYPSLTGEQLHPGVTKKFGAIFELPPYATGLKLELGDLGKLWSPKKYVKLEVK